MKHTRSKIMTLLALLLCASLVFAGCGKKDSGEQPDPTSAPVTEAVTDDNGNIPEDNGEPVTAAPEPDTQDTGDGQPETPNFVGGYSISLYHVGDNTIAVDIESQDIYNGYDGYLFFETVGDDGEPTGGISINRYSTFVSNPLVEDNGDYKTYSFAEIEGLGGSEGTNTVFGDGRMLVYMNKDGAWNEINGFKGTYELRMDEKVLAKGNADDIVSTMSEKDFNSLISEIQMSRKAENEIKADWVGSYISGYNSVPTYMEIEKSESGMLHFHVIMSGQEFDWFGEESYYNEADYDDIKYISASSSITADNGSSTVANMNFSTTTYRSDDAGIDMGCYLNDEYVNVYMNKISGAWHTAPENYEDVDRRGLVSENVFDHESFKPATDDYMLQIKGGENMSGLYVGNEMADCENIYTLYSYDENRYAVQYVEKYVLMSEKDAADAYKKLVTDMDDYYKKIYTYYQQGRNIYLVHNVKNDYSYTKIHLLDRAYGDDWYVDCHYIYTGDDSDGYYLYMYLSKPFTAEEYTMPIKKMLYWKGMAYDLPCTDDKNYQMRAEVNNMRIEFSVSLNDYVEGPHMSGAEDGYIRYHGDTAEGIRVYYSQYEEGAYVFVHEYTFGEEEITIREYKYDFAGPEDIDVTLDNYKTKTASEEYFHKFAVTPKSAE